MTKIGHRKVILRAGRTDRFEIDECALDGLEGEVEEAGGEGNDVGRREQLLFSRVDEEHVVRVGRHRHHLAAVPPDGRTDAKQ